jgi:HEAT repeat protein
VHSVDELLGVVIREEDDVRWTAIQELHALGTREVYDRAAALCRSAIASERIAGADVIGQLDQFATEAAQLLREMLGDSEAAVVESAVHALGQQQTAGNIELLAVAATHESSNVRWAVATALENLIADERAEKVLLTLMRDSESSVRDRATFAVGSLSDHDSPRVRAALAERLKDEDAAVANEAALGLARRHDARAIPYIAVAVESAAAGEIEEAADEITAPDMLTDLLKARDALGDAMGLERLIARCRARL